MAYMSTEHAKTIRDNLKKEFPNFKFSIRKHHYSTIIVSILSSPLDFTKDIEKSGYGYVQLNTYYLDRYEHSETLKKIKDIINVGNFDKSDAMTDYFHVGFYFDINIGDYNKPYKQII